MISNTPINSWYTGSNSDRAFLTLLEREAGYSYRSHDQKAMLHLCHKWFLETHAEIDLEDGVCVPPEEYEAFKRWKESRGG